MNKEIIIDSLLSLLFAVMIVVELVVGVNMFEKKRIADTTLIIEKSMKRGTSIGLIEEKFSWETAPEPDISGDVIQIDSNRFRINGTLTDDSNKQEGYTYYSSLESKESEYIRHEVVVDPAQIEEIRKASEEYFNGTVDAFINVMSSATEIENITPYQQDFKGGVIPIFYDKEIDKYIMYLDCVTSVYVLKCKDPFVVTDAKISVKYPDAKHDPLREHAWSTYEAGAIDNTRQQLLDSEAPTGNYTQSGLQDVLNYSYKDSVASNAGMYISEADEDKRSLMISYGTKKFDESGKSTDGSLVIDTTSTIAMSSEWKLTQTQYSYTYEGITINGLSGRRNNNIFEISGNATNMLSHSRPWVLCIKFMGENNKLLGLKVIDYRSAPIPANGTSFFEASISSSEDINITDIVALQFMFH